MKFDIDKIFGVDFRDRYGDLFSDVTNVNQLPSVERFALSGLEDFFWAASIAEEYAKRNYPLLVVEEIERTSGIDPLYHEPISGRSEIARTLKLHPLVNHNSPTVRHRKEGIENTLNISFHFPLLTLWREDYTPKEGDRIRYLGTTYGFQKVFVDDKSLLGQSGLFTFLSVDSAPLRGGDLKGVSNRLSGRT